MSFPPRPQSLRSPLRESVRVLGLYVRAQVLIAVVLGALYAIGFGIAGVPWWPLIAVVGSLTSVIPHIGGLIPLGLALLTDLLVGRSLTKIAVAFGVWLVISVLEGFVITPKLLSKPLGVGPLAVFAVGIASSLFFGPIGFLLAMPVLAVVMVFWRYFRER